MTERPIHPTVVRLADYSWRFLVIGAALAVLLWGIGQLSVVALPIAIALLLTRALQPVAAWLHARGLPAALAALAVVLGFLLIVAGATWFIVPSVAGQFDDVRETVTQGIDDLQDWLVEDAPFDLTQDDIDDAREWLVDRGGDLLRSSSSALTSGAFLLASIAAGAVLSLLLSFFMLKDGTKALSWGRSLLPAGRRGVADRLCRRIWQTLGGYLLGSTALGTVEAIAIGVTVWAVGGTLVAPIMILTFAAAFVPLVGAIAAGAVAVLVTLVTAGPTQALIVLIVAFVVQQFDGDLLAPLVYGRALEIHPAVILVVIAAGGSLFGFVGVLLAVPVTAVVINCAAELRASPTGSGDDLSLEVVGAHPVGAGDGADGA
ncbi:MAG: AI-2E family transporter [Actinomycetota bacterium]|nr:AI-2E family transporter [Actinomycetota bacterium]